LRLWENDRGMENATAYVSILIVRESIRQQDTVANMSRATK
jgi:hypothetical protein